MTAVTEGLQFSLLDGFIAQYPASGKLRESIYWLVKYRGFKKKKKGGDGLQRQKPCEGPCVLNVSSDCESVLPIAYLFKKLNAPGCGASHLFFFPLTKILPLHATPSVSSEPLYDPSFTASPPLHTGICFLNQTIDKSIPALPVQVSLCGMVISTCFSNSPPCPSVCLCLCIWLFLQ